MTPAAAIGAISGDRVREHLVHDVLHPQVDGEIDRRQFVAARQADRLQQRHILGIHLLFDAGNALVVDVDRTEDVRGLRAARIEALALGDEIQPRNAKLEDLFLDRRGQLTLDPYKSLVAGESFAQPVQIQFRQYPVQRLGRLVHIDDAARFGEQRRHPDVDRHLQPVAIKDGGPRRGNGVALLPLDAGVLHRRAQLDQPAADHPEHNQQRKDHPANPRPCQAAARLPRAIERNCGHALAGHRHG